MVGWMVAAPCSLAYFSINKWLGDDAWYSQMLLLIPKFKENKQTRKYSTVRFQITRRHDPETRILIHVTRTYAHSMGQSTSFSFSGNCFELFLVHSQINNKFCWIHFDPCCLHDTSHFPFRRPIDIFFSENAKWDSRFALQNNMPCPVQATECQRHSVYSIGN